MMHRLPDKDRDLYQYVLDWLDFNWWFSKTTKVVSKPAVSHVERG